MTEPEPQETLPETKVEEKTIVGAATFLKEYTGQTTDELIALESTHRIDSLVLAFEQALGQKAKREGNSSLSKEERYILAVEGLEREVSNGGYFQFFENSSCQYTPIIVEALTAIGCPITAEMTNKAIDVAGVRGEATQEAMWDVIYKEDDARDAALNDLDGRFYEGQENIALRLFEFIKSNREKIVLR
jgi:hypothetical protein